MLQILEFGVLGYGYGAKLKILLHGTGQGQSKKRVGSRVVVFFLMGV